MDIAAFSMLANAVVSILAPYIKIMGDELIKKTGEEIGKATGETAWNKTKQLYEKIKNQFSKKPAALEAIEDLEKSPDDPDIQAVTRTQLKKFFSEDETFAQEIAQIIKEISEFRKDDIFTSIVGDSSNLLQIANSSLTSGKDFVGRDKVEIHANNINIESPKISDNENWIKSRLEWLRRKHDLSGVDRITSTMDDMTLYRQGRSLFENRDYLEATIFWEKLWQKAPQNSEFESYLKLCLSKIAREEDIEKAISAMLGAAISAYYAGNYDYVISEMTKMLILNPSNERATELLEKARQAQFEQQEERERRLNSQ